MKKGIEYYLGWLLIAIVLTLVSPFWLLWLVFSISPEARYERLSERKKDLLTLEALGSKERCGMEIGDRIDDMNPHLKHTLGGLYPSLVRLEMGGCVKSRKTFVSYRNIEGERWTYKVTTGGMKKRHELQQEYEAANSIPVLVPT